MPRINNYDLYDDVYYQNSEFSTFFIMLIVGLSIFFWISGLFYSKNKINYIGQSILEFFAVIFGSIILAIGGLFFWFFNFLKFVFGLDNNTKNFGCLGCLVWLYRIIFISGIIIFFKWLLTQ